MGLDMYLRRKYYVKNWDHNPEKWEVTVTKGGKPYAIASDKISGIETEEIYWRKANAIHKWFVDNVQDGTDDCGHYELGSNQLQELLNAVNAVLKDHSMAEKLLPATDGFFFGSTDYDEYYFEDLEHTKKELERILSGPLDGGNWFEYHSSW